TEPPIQTLSSCEPGSRLATPAWRFTLRRSDRSSVPTPAPECLASPTSSRRRPAIAGPRLETPVTELARVSETYGERLHRLGIDTVRDLLLHYPRRHRDFSSVIAISLVQPWGETTVRPRLLRIVAHWTRVRHQSLTAGVLSEDSTVVAPGGGARGVHPG